MSAEPATCAACGESIVQPFSTNKDFCSRECYRAGRAFCKQCGNPLFRTTQYGGGFKRVYCNDICKRKYYRNQIISPERRKELERSTCKNCGAPIDQPRNGHRLFCSKKCTNQYHGYNDGRDYSLNDRWGNYASETRRILLELETLKLGGTARRLALAIDREYKIRHSRNKEKSQPIACECKVCGKDFHIKAWSNRSRDYCSRKCWPRGPEVILTWEKVDEIRSLYSTGQFSQAYLGEKYGVAKSTIAHVIGCFSWKPEQDPRNNPITARARRVGEKHPQSKLTWEKVDEIRSIFATRQLPYREIGKTYGIGKTTIGRIVRGETWKPEHDPRRKRETSEENKPESA